MKSRIMFIELKTHPGGHDDRGFDRLYLDYLSGRAILEVRLKQGDV